MKLADTAAWKRISAVWAEVEAAVTGTDAHALNEGEVRRLQAAVADAGADVDLLVKAGLLGGTEAALLKDGLDLLAGRLPFPSPQRYLYDPKLPIRGRIRRLNERLPLLQWLADHEKPHPAAIGKALKATEQDIALLADADQLSTLRPAERAEADTTRRLAEVCVAKIKARLAGAAK